jgi:hydroxyacylglutathione hydrolase
MKQWFIGKKNRCGSCYLTPGFSFRCTHFNPTPLFILCSAHEYTSNNAKFAASVEPGNAELMARVAEINALRKRGESTVPSQLGVEKRTNPFLRCDFSEEIRKNVGVVAGDSDADAFGKVRRAKDTFRG